MNDFCIVHKLGDDDRVAAALRGDIPPLMGEVLTITRVIVIPSDAKKQALTKCKFIIKTSINPALQNLWCKQLDPYPSYAVFSGCTATFE